ncbi:MAG: formate dehydrogenase accessory protein FdhE [Chloroflexota bacterium]|nr:MAG: formate dehydrogenase accessory protein FdhE [Chloroflexota bacterium]
MAAPLSPTTHNSTGEDASTQEILRRMDALARQKPEHVEALAFFRALLPILRRAEVDVPSFALTPEAARKKFALHQPLLAGEDLPFDTEAAKSLFLQLCRLSEDDPESPLHSQACMENRHMAAARIRQAVECDELDLKALLQTAAEGRWQELIPLVDVQRLEPDVLRTLAELSLAPSLRAWAREAAIHVDLDEWRQEICPMCGSRPMLSEIQGKEGVRRLRCGLCGAGWYYPRLKCAICGNEDYHALGTIYVEGEKEKYRLQTCDACKNYIKVVITFEPNPVELLMVEDLVTLHLDVIAGEQGFSRFKHL